MAKAMRDQNDQMAKEKRDMDMKQRMDELNQAQHDVNYTLNHDFMTENPNTEKSMLADHRVKPYHFKGFNAEQTASVMHERSQQMKEQEMLKRTKEEEDKLWALQQEHLRRQQVLQDRENKRQQRAMAEGTRATHDQQRQEHNIKWKDPYGDRS